MSTFRQRLAMGLLLSCALMAQAATSYVATSGDDAGAGTAQQPYRTIGHAVARAQPGDTVLIGQGTYVESLLLKTAGTPEQPITLQSVKRHGAIISGPAKLLTGDKTINDITLRGLVFHSAQRDIWSAIVDVRSGWRVEDCVFEGGGVDTRQCEEGNPHAQDVLFLRDIAQDTWGNGMTAQGVDNLVVRDCVLRRCNRSGERVADCTSASKLFNTNHCRVENLVSYDNVGAGWWFDFQNVDFRITGGTFFGNHGVRGDNQGGGIWLEKNSQGYVANNLCYSNYGSGLSIWAMDHLTVEHNMFVDNDTTWWRAQGLDSQGGEKLWDITVRNNIFKDWRRDAQSINYVEIGNIKRVTIDGNIYDPPAGNPLWFWWGKDGKMVQTHSLQETRQTLGFEQNAVIKAIPFDRQLFPTHGGLDIQVGTDGEQFSIDDALAKVHATVGMVVTIPVQGRLEMTPVSDDTWSTQVYDLAQKRHVRLLLPSAALETAIAHGVSRFAMWKPVYLKVKMTKLDEYDFAATALGVAP
jgi:parallel beta-helix repeat protein